MIHTLLGTTSEDVFSIFVGVSMMMCSKLYRCTVGVKMMKVKFDNECVLTRVLEVGGGEVKSGPWPPHLTLRNYSVTTVHDAVTNLHRCVVEIRLKGPRWKMGVGLSRSSTSWSSVCESHV